MINFNYIINSLRYINIIQSSNIGSSCISSNSSSNNNVMHSKNNKRSLRVL